MLDPTPYDVHRAAKVFKLLSHPDRLRIVCHLSHGQRTTQKDLIHEMGWPQSTMARHVADLRAVGIVSARRKGRKLVLELASPVVQDLMAIVCGCARPDGGELFPAPPEELLESTERAHSHS